MAHSSYISRARATVLAAFSAAAVACTVGVPGGRMEETTEVVPGSGWPGHQFGEGFGFNIETWTTTDEDLDRLAATGAKLARIFMPWENVENEKGVYDWGNFDHLVQRLVDSKIKVVVALTGGNQFYTTEEDLRDGDGHPFTQLALPSNPEQTDAFARYAAATAKHYSGLYGAANFIWQAGNEMETLPASDYGQLAAQACRAIKQSVPNAVVTFGSLSSPGDGDIDFGYIEHLFDKANPFACADHFAAHVTRAYAPESTVADYGELRDIFAPHLPAGMTEAPIFIDEQGYSTPLVTNDAPSEEYRNFHDAPRADVQQAALMVRAYLTNLENRIPVTLIKDFKETCATGDTYVPVDLDLADRCQRGVLYNYNGGAKVGLETMNATWGVLRGRELLGVMKPVEDDKCPPDIHAQLYGPRTGDATNVLVLWTESAKGVEVNTRKIDTVETVFGDFRDVPWRVYVNEHPVFLTSSGGTPGFDCKPLPWLSPSP